MRLASSSVPVKEEVSLVVGVQRPSGPRIKDGIVRPPRNDAPDVCRPVVWLRNTGADDHGSDISMVASEAATYMPQEAFIARDVGVSVQQLGDDDPMRSALFGACLHELLFDAIRET